MARVALLNCEAGISGDMMLASLIDCGADLNFINSSLKLLGSFAPQVISSTTYKQTIRATSIEIVSSDCAPGNGLDRDGSTHRSLSQILESINSCNFSEVTCLRATSIFERLAKVESIIHGIEVDQVQFHELGAIDSIADIVGTCLAMEFLEIETLLVGPISLGTGSIQSEHGILPNPAPATVELLKGFVIKTLPSSVELTTPTGAGILACLAQPILAQPILTEPILAQPILTEPLSGPSPMIVEFSGYGAGKAELELVPNVLQVIVGLPQTQAVLSPEPEIGFEQLRMIETNIDDVTGEIIGYTLEKLIAQGARDAWITSYHGKKSRPGYVLTVMCDPTNVSKLARIILSETGTLGYRTWPVDRVAIDRQITSVQLDGAVIRMKYSSETSKPEFDDVAALAQETDMSYRDISQMAVEKFNSQSP